MNEHDRFAFLVKRLRNCATNAAPCKTCDLKGDVYCTDTLMAQAATAMEELIAIAESYNRSMETCANEAASNQEALEYAQRQYDLAVEDLEKLNFGDWIPVSERLPETEEEVVVAFKDKPSGEWWFRIDNYVDGAFCYNTAFNRKILYWYPLPKPPKEREHGQI